MILAASTDRAGIWYFGRATGLVALVLLSGIIVLGVLGPLRVSPRRGRGLRSAPCTVTSRCWRCS